MQTQKLSIGSQTQEVYTGHNFFADVLETYIQKNNYSNIIVLVDSALTRGSHLQIQEALNGIEIIEINVGPASKSLESTEELLELFYSKKINRSSLVIVFGGGTLCDLCGFACSIYMRGINYVQIGTTLMAQVDCIMSKVAINGTGIKNLYGSFHTPCLTINDTLFLESGLVDFKPAIAEVIKHYLIEPNGLFDIPKQPTKVQSILPVIQHSVQTKAHYVEPDPFDQKGGQKALSLGHTFANLLESVDSNINHGNAVWIGLTLALSVSEKVYNFDPIYLQAVKDIIKQNQIPLPTVKIHAAEAKKLMKKDKLNTDSGYALVLLQAIGFHKITKNLEFSIIANALKGSQWVEYIE